MGCCCPYFRRKRQFDEEFDRVCRRSGHSLETCPCQACQSARQITQQLGVSVQRRWPFALVFKRGIRTALVSLQNCPSTRSENRVIGYIESDLAWPNDINGLCLVLNRSFATPEEAVSLVREFLRDTVLSPPLDNDTFSTDGEDEPLEKFDCITEE